MTDVTIYHNPRCSKSRETLALLQAEGFTPHIIEYIKTPLQYEALDALSAHFELKDFVRTNEPEFKAQNLSLSDKKSILTAMVHTPKLMQRPIVTYNNQAAIGRPPEAVLGILKT